MTVCCARICVPVEGSRWEPVFQIGEALGIPGVNLRNWLRHNHVPRRQIPIFLDKAERLGIALTVGLLRDLRGTGEDFSNTSSATGFIGVTPRKRTGKFQASIVIAKKRHHIGCFDTAIEAARVYDEVALAAVGRNALTNFPKSREVELSIAAKKFVLHCDHLVKREPIPVKPRSASSRMGVAA